MSINIITDINEVDKNNFIWDVESVGCIIKDNDYCKEVLRRIEKGSYLNEISYLDRYGYKLHSDDMSTTSKAYICLDRFPGKIINFTEVGKGSGDLLLDKVEGSLFIPLSRVSGLFSSSEDRSISINLNGKEFTNYFDFIDYLEEV